MEEFKAPVREIEERFTRSELVIIAWRSQEMHHNFKKQRGDSIVETSTQSKSGKYRKEYPDGIGPEGMPDHFFDEHGDFNLSKVTGEEAKRYFETRLKIPMPPGVSKIRDESEASQEIRAAYGIRR